MKTIIWTNRYSDTDESDKLGRWARVGYLEHKSKDPFKTTTIAWINKIKDKYCCYVYIGEGRFENRLTTEQEAKDYCENTLLEFISHYLE